MITDVIREAKSEHEIYFLLTAYLEAIHFSDKLQPQAELADILPIASIEKVRDRFERFIYELDRASKELNHEACLVLKEGMLIFNTALNRLEALASRQNLPGAPPARAAGPARRVAWGIYSRITWGD